MMLIEEQMELVERAAGDLPMMLFVHVAEGHGVGENLIQIPDAVGADFFVEGDGEFRDFSIGLNFTSVLMQVWSGALGPFFDLRVTGAALHFFCSHSGSPFTKNWDTTRTGPCSRWLRANAVAADAVAGRHYLAMRRSAPATNEFCGVTR